MFSDFQGLSLNHPETIFDLGADRHLDSLGAPLNLNNNSGIGESVSLQLIQPITEPNENNNFILDLSLDNNLTILENLSPTDSLLKTHPKELVFIDSSIAEYQSLISGWNPDLEIFILDSTRDELAQISDVLNNYQNLDGIHLFSHGNDGELKLGNTVLNQNNLNNYQNLLNRWGEALNEAGNLLIYGCNIAETAGGKNLIDLIAEITGADVAASSDRTGNIAYGGDNWLLEYNTGNIETTSLVGDSNFTTILSSVSYSNNVLTYSGSSTDNLVEISTNGSNLIIKDNESISISGVADVDTNTNSVTIALANLASMENFKIDGADGNDKVNFTSNLYLQGGNLEVTADNIIVNSGVTISTRKISGNNQDTDASIANSGQVTFTAKNEDNLVAFTNKDRSITLESGAKILTHTTNSYTAGDIKFKSELNAGNLLSMLVGFGIDFTPDTATISLTDATLKGNNISLEAIVSTNASLKEELVKQLEGDGVNSFWEGMGNVFGNNLLSVGGNLLGSSFYLPLQIVHQNAKALIDIKGNSTIESAKDVAISTETTVDSTIRAITGGKITQALAKYNDIFQKFSIAYSGAVATAHTLIGDGVNINSEGNIDITAKAEATASATARTTMRPPEGAANNKTWAVSFGLAYSDLDVLTKISQGANIVSEKNINIKALGNNKTEGSGEVAIYDDGKAGITLGLGISLGDVKAVVDGNLTAKGDGNTNNEPELTFQEKTAGLKDGDKVTTAGIGIYAYLTSEDSASASSAVRGEPSWSDKISFGELQGNFIADKFSSPGKNAGQGINNNQSNVSQATQQAGASGGNNNQLSGWQSTGSAAILVVNNDVSVEVGGVLNSEKDISLKANIEETPQTSSESALADDPAKPDGGNDSALALAFSVGVYSNDVQTIVKNNARLDAKKAIDISSDLIYPWLTDLTDAQTYFDAAKDLQGTFGKFFNGKLGLSGAFLNSFTRSFGQAADSNPDSGLSVAGSINVAVYDNTSKTTIQSGAQINQNVNYQTNSQSVDIAATTQMRLMNMTGIFDINLNETVINAAKGKDPWASVLNLSGAEGSRKGAGGSLFVMVMDNDTIAEVQDSVLIRTGVDGGLNVKANADILHVSLTQAGSKGSDFALAGSIAFIFQNSNTYASLGTGVKVTGGSDVTIEALDKTTHVNVVGSVATGGSSGDVIGVSIGINTIVRDTLAYIGNADDREVGTGGTQIDAKNLKVNAQANGLAVTIGLAGTKSSTNKPPEEQAPEPQNNTPPLSNDPFDGDSLSNLFGGGEEEKLGNSTNQKPKQKYGLGLSAVVNFNLMTDNTKAFVNDSGTIKAQKLDLISGNNTNLIAIAGSIALSSNNNESSFEKSSNALAGAVGINILTGETSSFIKGTNLDLAGDVTARAIRDGDIVAIVAGAAGKTDNSGTAVAGSVGINLITFDTLAYIDGGKGKIKGKTILEARDGSNAPNQGDYTIGKSGSTSIWAIAGSAGYSSDKGRGKASDGYGVGISFNLIEGDTLAEIKNSNFEYNGLELNATSQNDIRSIAASLGVSNSSTSGGIGAAGTFSWNWISNSTNASIQNSTLIGTGNVSLTSEGKSDIIAVSGAIGISVGGGQGKGIGAGIAVNHIDNDNFAYITGSNLTTNGSLSLSANSEGSIVAITAGIAYSGGSGGLSLAGSVAVNSIGNDAKAYINNSAIDTLGSNVSLFAKDNSVIQALSGGVAVGGGTSIGASIAINAIDNDILTYIDSSTVNNAGKIQLVSTSTSQIDLLSIGGAGGKDFTLGGSLAVNVIANDVGSYIANGSNITANDDIILTAQDQSTTNALSGGIGISTSSSAIGAAIAVNNTTNDVFAYIGGSAVTSKNGKLDLSATSTALVNTLAVGGAGGNSFALGGAIAVNVLSNSLEASIKDNSTVSARKDINLKTSQTKEVKQGNWFSKVLTFITTPMSDEDIPTQGINSLAGGFGLSSGGSGVGASLAINVISNEYRAFIDRATVTSEDGNILVDSKLDTQINAITVGGAFAGGSAGVSGSISVNTINNDILAYISNSTVNAAGSVGVLANSNSEITLYTGTLSVGSSAGVGGSISVNTITNDIFAYVDNSTVNAKGNYEISVPVAQTDNTTKNNVRGLAAIATSDEELNLRAANGAGGGSAAVVGTISVNVFNNDTLAYIQGNSKINDGMTGGNANQVVQVKAFNNSDIDVKAGGLAIGGSAGIGVSSDVTVIHNNTQAYIDGSTVSAQKSVDVTSFTQEKYDAIVVSGGGSGTAGVAGNIVVAVLDSTNKAYINNSTVNSQGSLNVIAHNTTTIGPNESFDGLLLGAASIGGVAGVAGSVLVTVTSNDTTAYIRDSATNSKQTTKVEAQSTNYVSTSVVTGGAGLYAGVAGSIAVNLISTTTKAYIDESTKNTQINLDGSFANTSQEVIVNAQNNASINSDLGSLGGGAVGAGVSVDVGRIANVTSAYMGDGVEANAQKNLQITATASQKADSTAIALAGGLVGIQGSVAVYNIGTQMAQEQLDALKARDAQGGVDNSKPTFDGEVNRQMQQASNIGGSIGNSGFATNASNRVNQQTSQNNINTSATVDKGTTAYIGSNAKINAGNVNIAANNKATVNVNTGGVAVGIGAIGGAVAIVDIEQTTLAFIGRGTQVTSTGNIDIVAQSVLNDPQDNAKGVRALAGGAGGIALGAAVGIFNSDNDTQAYLDNGVNITQANNITVIAGSSSQIEAQGLGAQFGTAAIGATIAKAREEGTTEAFVGNDVKIENANKLKVNAIAKESASAITQAAAGGIISGNGSAPEATVNPSIKAYVGDRANINVAKDVTILSDVTLDGDSDARGISIGYLSVGVSIAEVEIRPQINTYAGNTASIAAENVTIETRLGKPIVLADTSFNPSTAVNNSADTIAFSNKHGLDTGDRLVYSNGDGTDLGGLKDGQSYSVLVIDNKTIQLGSEFDAAKIDPKFNTIKFKGNHGLNDGDKVVYEAKGGIAIGGLTSGNTYYVKVIDSQTIKLTTDPNYTPITQGAQIDDIDTTKPATIIAMDENHGFQNGDALNYDTRTAKFIVVDEIPDTGGEDSLFNLAEDLINDNEIYSASHGFETNDKVIYKTSGVALGGLVKDGIYYIIKENDDYFKLSATKDGTEIDITSVPTNQEGKVLDTNHELVAVGLKIQQVDRFNFTYTSDNPNTNKIVINNHGLGNGQAVTYNTSGTALSGLTVGTTYYLVNVTANDFQLANSINGTPIDFGANFSNHEILVKKGLQQLEKGVIYYVIDKTDTTFKLATTQGGLGLILNKDDLTGSGTNHLFTKEKVVDLTTPGNGIHNFHLDLNNAGTTGNKHFLSSGANSSVPSQGDNKFSVSSQASAGGLIGVDATIASLDVVVNANTYLADNAKITATGNVNIVSLTSVELSGNSDSNVYGLVAVGAVKITENVNTTNNTYVGSSARIQAGGNVNISSQSDRTLSLYSSGGAGSLITFADAEGSATIIDNTKTNINNNATIISNKDLTVKSSSNTEANVKVIADGVGFYADADADSSLSFDGTNETNINANAHLEGRKVDIQAIVNNLKVESRAEAEGAGLIGNIDAHANTNLTGTSALVNIYDGAFVKGDFLNLLAKYENVTSNAIALADCDGLGGDTDTDATNNMPVEAKIWTGSNSSLEAYKLNVKADLENFRYNTTAESDKAWSITIWIPFIGDIEITLDFGSESKNESFAPKPVIDFNSYVTLVARAMNPVLIVDSSGNIVQKSDNLTVNIDSNNVVVQDINNNGTGDVYFIIPSRTNEAKSNGYFVDRGKYKVEDPAFDSVLIENYSNKNLVINNISVINPGGTPQINYDVNVNNKTIATTFQNGQNPLPVNPTLVEIENWGSSDLILQGIINNPHDRTILYSQGDILARGNFQQIVTRDLTMTSITGDIGNSTQKIIAQLNRGYSPITPDVPSSDIYLKTEAYGSIFLDLSAKQLDDKPVTVAVQKMTASMGSVNLKINQTTNKTNNSVTALYDFTKIIAGSDINIDAGTTTTNIQGQTDFLNNTAFLDWETLTEINGNTNTVRGLLDVVAGGYIQLTETVGGVNLKQAISYNDRVWLTVAESSNLGENLLLLDGAKVQSGKEVTFSVGDDFQINSTATITAGTNINIKADYQNNDLTGSIVNIFGWIYGQTMTLATDSNQDTFNIRRIATTTNLFAYEDDDIVNVGSNQPELSGKLDEIFKRLNIDAGVQRNRDILNLDDWGDTDNNTGVVTAQSVSGLDLGQGIYYSQFELLDLKLGSGADDLTLLTTSAFTNIDTGAGNDRLRIGPLLDATGQVLAESMDGNALTTPGVNIVGNLYIANINTGAGDDYIKVNRNSAVLNIQGGNDNDTFEVNAAKDNSTILSNGLLNLSGDGGNNKLIVNGNSLNETIDISGSSVKVYNSRTINNNNIQTLVVNGNLGIDTINIDTGSASAISTLEVNGNAGNDTVNMLTLLSGIAATINGNENNDTFKISTSTLDRILGSVSIYGGDGTDVLNLNDLQDLLANTGILTKTSVIGLGLGSALNYYTMETLNINLGSGADTFTSLDNGAVTNLNLGLGNDIVRLGPNLDVDGKALAEIEPVLQSSLIYGNSYTMTIKGGKGNDSIKVNRNNASLSLFGEDDTDTFELNTLNSLTGLILNSNVTIDAGLGTDLVKINGSSVAETIQINAQGVKVTNSRTVAFSNLENLTVNGDKGQDQILVNTAVTTTGSTASSSTLKAIEISGGLDSDTFSVYSLFSTIALKMFGNGGDDLFKFGNASNKLSQILGSVVIDGGDNNDTFIINNQGETLSRSGNITSNKITGFGLGTLGITYSNLEDLTVNLGNGADTIAVNGTHSGKTTINTNGGNDIITINSIIGQTFINSGSGDDKFSTKVKLSPLGLNFYDPEGKAPIYI
jgi:hypothetical protein